jgi:putative addiction module component (TIGR02574 family)
VTPVSVCLEQGRDAPYAPVMNAIPIEQLTDLMLALPSDARALLADRLVESLDPITDESVRDAWASEALRRLDEIRSGAVEAIPGDVAMAEIRAAWGA